MPTSSESPSTPAGFTQDPTPDLVKSKPPKLGRGIETMFRTMYRVNMNLSGLADAKANIMISINGLIVSILLASIAPKIDSNPILLVPTSVLLVALVISLVFAVLAARPRVPSEAVTLEQVRGGLANILFFGNFSNMTRDDFVTGMNELIVNPDNMYHTMILDIYGIGLVLRKKYRLLRVSYTVFMVGLVVGVVAFIIAFYFAAQSGQIPDVSTPILPV